MKIATLDFKRKHHKEWQDYCKFVRRIKRLCYVKENIVCGMSEFLDIPKEQLEQMSITMIYLIYHDECEDWIYGEELAFAEMR